MKLLEETLDKMTEVDKTPEDVAEVQWAHVVGMRRIDNGYDAVVDTFDTTWDRFAEVIRKVEYDDGFGTQEINSTLKIVFKDMSWLERAEYDGAESWSYKCSPKPAKNNVTDYKDILCHVWEDPCNHCIFEDSRVRCDGCGSSYSFRHWEEK